MFRSLSVRSWGNSPCNQWIILCCYFIVFFQLFQTSEQVDTFKISVNLPTDDPGPSGAPAVNIVNAIRLVETDINSIDPNYQFNVVYTPSGNNRFSASLAMESAIIDKNAHGVVGDFSSYQTIPQCFAGVRHQMWVCSGAASTTELSVKDDYPYFFRTVADEPQQGDILAYFVKYMNWKSANLIQFSDTYGTSVGSAFAVRAPTLGISVTTQVFAVGVKTGDLVAALKAMKAKLNRIMVLSGPVDETMNVLRQARSLGMVGKDWAWIMPSIAGSFFSSGSGTQFDQESTNGLFYIFQNEMGNNAAYNAFMAKWQNAYGAISPSPYTMLFIDCLYAIARGLIKLSSNYGGAQNIINRNYDATVANFTTSFEGLSGPISFDANGNRNSRFSVYNLQNGVSQLSYSVDDNRNINLISNPLYGDLSADKPSAQATKADLTPYWTYGGPIVMAILNAMLALYIVVASFYVVFFSKPPIATEISGSFVFLVSCGCLLIVASNFLSLGLPTSSLCSASLVTFVFGVEFIIGTCISKAFTIYKIFDNAVLASKNPRAKDGYLYLTAIATMIPQTIILAIWLTNDPLSPSRIEPDGALYYYNVCAGSDNNRQTTYQVLSIIYNLILLIIMAFFATMTRNIDSTVHLPMWMIYTAQNSFLSGIVIALFNYFNFEDADLIAAIVKLAMIIYAVTFAYFSLIGRLFSKVKKSIIVSSDIKSDDAISTKSNTNLLKASDGKTSIYKITAPVKRKSWLLTTWLRHTIQLNSTDRQLIMVADNDVGVCIPLSQCRIESNPINHPLCVEIVPKSGKSYMIQFKQEEDQTQWIGLLSQAGNEKANSNATLGREEKSNSGSPNGHPEKAESKK